MNHFNKNPKSFWNLISNSLHIVDSGFQNSWGEWMAHGILNGNDFKRRVQILPLVLLFAHSVWVVRSQLDNFFFFFLRCSFTRPCWERQMTTLTCKFVSQIGSLVGCWSLRDGSWKVMREFCGSLLLERFYEICG